MSVNYLSGMRHSDEITPLLVVRGLSRRASRQSRLVDSTGPPVVGIHVSPLLRGTTLHNEPRHTHKGEAKITKAASTQTIAQSKYARRWEGLVCIRVPPVIERDKLIAHTCYHFIEGHVRDWTAGEI